VISVLLPVFILCNTLKTQVKVNGPGGGGSKEDEDYWLDSESGG
jgi:hypothetical protein